MPHIKHGMRHTIAIRPIFLRSIFLRTILLRLVLLTLIFPCALPAATAQVQPATTAPTPDPALEQRVLKLSEELRCLVCQNQTIADSEAPLAVDLRQQVREQLTAGKDESAVIQFMVTRYGDFVLYRPPVKPATLLLWFGPPLLLLTGLWLFMRTVRRRRTSTASLSSEEQARLRTLLGEGTSRQP